MGQLERNDVGYGLEACFTLIGRVARFEYDMGGAAMVMESSDPADVGITQSATDVLRAYYMLTEGVRSVNAARTA